MLLDLPWFFWLEDPQITSPNQKRFQRTLQHLMRASKMNKQIVSGQREKPRGIYYKTRFLLLGCGWFIPEPRIKDLVSLG